MRVRLCALLTVLCLTAIPARPAAAEPPALVVGLRSLDGLLADAKYLAGLAGREEEAKQFEGFFKVLTGPKGLEGIDTKKPLGLYGVIATNPGESTAVALVPIADEKAVLALLERLNLKAEKGTDGVYTVRPENAPVPVHFRFANQHAYVTALNKSALAPDKLLNPADVLPAGGTATLTASLHFSRIPDEVKQIALQQMKLHLAHLKDEKAPGEAAVRQEFKAQAVQELADRVTTLVKDGSELAFRYQIDPKASELSAQLTLTAKPSSKLAAAIAGFGQSKSLFAGALAPDAAMQGLVHFALPESAQKALAPVVDELIRKALAGEQDAQKREKAAKVLKALEPSLKAGEVDAALSLRGPTQGQLYAFVAGVKLREGDALDKVVRDLVKDLPKDEQAKIRLDAETAGPVKIHRIDVQKELDAETRQALGTNPFFFAIRPDALFLAGGEGGLGVLREALAAKAGAGPQVRFEMALARLAPVLAKENKAAPKVAGDVFTGADKGNDQIRLAVEGGPALTARVVLKAQVVKFFSLLEKSKKEGK
jgi:hypothetical protein